MSMELAELFAIAGLRLRPSVPITFIFVDGEVVEDAVGVSLEERFEYESYPNRRGDGVSIVILFLLSLNMFVGNSQASFPLSNCFSDRSLSFTKVI